jgi:SAM-dependent methyltransferase
MKQYWNIAVKELSKKHKHSLWRKYSDAVNSRLWAECMHLRRVGSLLKTDSFDEIAGRGLYPMLTQRSDILICIDISDRVLHKAACRYDSLNGVNADVRTLPFGDEAFNAIFSNSTLDHFNTQSDIVKSLHEFYRILKPSGRLIITMDNPENPIVAIRNALPFPVLNRLGITPYYIGRTLSHRRLSYHLKAAGFEIDSVTAIMHFPRIFIVLLSLFFERAGNRGYRQALLSLFMAFENLQNYSTRYLTGNFVAVSAIKPCALKQTDTSKT